MRTVIAVLVFLTILSAQSVTAAQEEDQGGFHGAVILGGLVYSGRASQLAVDTDNRKIKSLDEETDTRDQLAPILIGDISYVFADSGTMISLSVGMDNDGASDDLGAGQTLSLGVTQFFSDESLVSVGIGYGWGEVWKDPYLTGVKRKETSTAHYRLSAGYDYREDRGFFAAGHYLRATVDDDDIGRRISTLKRDGSAYRVETGYRFKINDNIMLAPSLAWARNEMDGAGNSCHAGFALLTYHHRVDRLGFQTELALGRRLYDRKHPVFGRTREETELVFSETVTYESLFGNPRLSLYGLVAYGGADANIDFFDSDGFAIGMGVGYAF